MAGAASDGGMPSRESTFDIKEKTSVDVECVHQEFIQMIKKKFCIFWLEILSLKSLQIFTTVCLSSILFAIMRQRGQTV